MIIRINNVIESIKFVKQYSSSVNSCLTIILTTFPWLNVVYRCLIYSSRICFLSVLMWNHFIFIPHEFLHGCQTFYYIDSIELDTKRIYYNNLTFLWKLGILFYNF